MKHRLPFRGRRAVLGALVAASAAALFAVAGAQAHHAKRGSSGGGTGSVSRTGTAKGPLDARTLAKVTGTVRLFKQRTGSPGVLVGIWSPKGTFVSATGVADL